MGAAPNNIILDQPSSLEYRAINIENDGPSVASVIIHADSGAKTFEPLKTRKRNSATENNSPATIKSLGGAAPRENAAIARKFKGTSRVEMISAPRLVVGSFQRCAL